jgi:5-methylcytosine-specific restriction endonuclease McrA
MPSKSCPYCHAIVRESDWFTHLRGHSDRRRPRRGTTAAWRVARKQALARDGYRCTTCWATGSLEVHHIDGDWRNNLLVNLATLCERCHKHLKKRG